MYDIDDKLYVVYVMFIFCIVNEVLVIYSTNESEDFWVIYNQVR